MTNPRKRGRKARPQARRTPAARRKAGSGTLARELAAARAQLAATAEILGVISESPTDARPVFEAIVGTASRLFGCSASLQVLREGMLHIGAGAGFTEAQAESAKTQYPRPFDPGTSSVSRAMLEGRVIEIPDIEAPGVPRSMVSTTRAVGKRAAVLASLRRGDAVVGLLGLTWDEPGRRLDDRQRALLKTFADQAVIAIENARLFKETKEALERQTATAEILEVIASSLSDIQPVFESIAASALKLCEGSFSLVTRFDGSRINLVAMRNVTPEAEAALRGPNAPGRGNATARAIEERRRVEITDVHADPEYRLGDVAAAAKFRSALAVPMLREGEPVGAITVCREVAGHFPGEQVALLEAFANQAVIAIENVRLFRELQSRTEALTKSVNRLTALGEVGQAISSTLDVETVLTAIVQRAVQLTGLDGGSIYEYDEGSGRFHLRAAENIEEEIVAVYRDSPIRPGEGAVGRAGTTREPVVVEDVLDGSYQSRVRELLIRSGSRALLAVPLLRDEHLLGALVVNRKSPGPFAPDIVDLLKTFATQSALAIQNARLYREIAEKGRQLEAASRHKSQFLASMSHELRTPLNAILGFNEMLLGQVYGEVPADMKEPLEDIQKSGRHLLRLINNVLDLAKIEAGRMELALADYAVQDVVENVRATLRPLAEAKGLELRVVAGADLPLAHGDAGRITQCLMNLAGNSLKFTKAGHVEVAVAEKGGLLRWRVSDTGIGIPADKLGSLFTEFRQTDATIASEYGGTGLGLSITKKFIEMHGGRIWVESEPGRGSAFHFELPLRAAPGAVPF